MKYKGFVISPSYYTGSDWKFDKCGAQVPRKQASKDIEYYEIFDPIDNMSRFGAGDTIGECKQTIDGLLGRLDMKDNTQTSWDKLGS